MKFLTTEEAKSWCQARGLKVTADRYLHYEPENPHCFTLGLPSPEPATRMARFHAAKLCRIYILLASHFDPKVLHASSR